MSESPRILIVGGVAAGMSAASQAKRRSPDARVTVFERGSHISYGACGMPYNIEDPGRDIEDLVVLSADKARQERHIELHLRHEVVGIDPAGASVQVRDLETGEERTEAYDALVLATGASAVRLPLPGFDLPGLVALRNLEDGAEVKRLVAEDARKAVILGAGYIGMEMAHVLRARGLEVTVLEKLPRILPGWGSDAVEAVEHELQEHGVGVETGVTVTGAEAGPSGAVERVMTDSGTVEADLVLQAVGIRPNVRLAADAGLRIGETGAIWVTQYQQTSAEGIWSAGDCSEAYHRVLRRNAWIPLGTTANKQGRVAGANTVGATQRFAGIVGTAGFQVFDLEVARSGLGLEQAKKEGFEPVSVTIRQRSRAHGYPGASAIQVTLVADEPTGVLLGAEIVGRDGAALRSNVIGAALASHMTVSDLQGLDLVYAPPFAPVWDPILVAANQLSKRVGRQS